MCTFSYFLFVCASVRNTASSENSTAVIIVIIIISYLIHAMIAHRGEELQFHSFILLALVISELDLSLNTTPGESLGRKNKFHGPNETHQAHGLGK
jgi:hypothetical protein